MSYGTDKQYGPIKIIIPGNRWTMVWWFSAAAGVCVVAQVCSSVFTADIADGSVS